MSITNPENALTTSSDKVEHEGFYEKYLLLASHLCEMAMSALKYSVDADDYIQDAFEYIIVKKKEAESEGSELIVSAAFIKDALAYINKANSVEIKAFSLESIGRQTLESLAGLETPLSSLNELVHEPTEDMEVTDAIKNQLSAMIGTLSEKYADIVRKTYGLDGESILTNTEIAKIYGVSRQMVQRINKVVIQKFKKALNISVLKDFYQIK
jgi:RNA polymerase sigma factor (sigma-70 family)